jgi:hypothetical protein
MIDPYTNTHVGMGSEQERLKQALSSDSIKPLYEDWSKSVDMPNKIARHIFKPFLIGMYVAILYAGMAAYHHLRNWYDFAHRPEVVQLEQIKRTQGEDAVAKIVEANKEKYKPALDEYILNERKVKDNFNTCFGVFVGTTLVSLGSIGVAIANSRRKRRKLEDALNEQGLSLGILEQQN